MSDHKLDGSERIKPIPFDAHEQASRGVHVETKKDSPDLDPALVAEYPKAVDHVDNPHGKGHKEPVLAHSREDEEAYKAAKESE